MNINFGSSASNFSTLNGSNSPKTLSPRVSSKNLDISIDNFKRNKSNTKYLTLDTSSKNDIFNTSSNALAFNTSYSAVSSPRSSAKQFNFASVSTIGKNYSKGSSSKIMRELNYINKEIHSSRLSNMNNFRNRPMVNLSRPEFDLNSRNYLALSPTVHRKNYLVTGNVLKNYKEKKQYNFMVNSKYLNGNKNQDVHSVEQYMRGTLLIFIFRTPTQRH